MSRTARTNKNIIISAVVLVAVGLPVIGWVVKDAKPEDSIKPSSSQVEQAETTYISYQGEDGKTALELLKQEAKVKTESSSLGDYVVSINGNDGSGTKYWLFYVNGKEAAEGAGTYQTKTGETIEWKLQ